MSAKNSKSLYMAALALFCLGVGYLAVSGFAEGSMPFRNVSEALAMPPDKLQAIRLFGSVKGEGIAALEEGPGVRFQLADKDDPGKILWVVYKGPVPDAFKEGAEVIAEGSLVKEAALASGESAPLVLFSAKSLMTKCPSKYQKENRG